MTTTSHQITFNRECDLEVEDTILLGEFSCDDLEASIIVDPNRTSSDFFPPCPNRRYFIYLSKSDSPVDITGINCTIGGIGPTAVPVNVDTIQTTQNNHFEDAETEYWDGESKIELEGQQNLESVSVYISGEGISNEYDSVCIGDKKEDEIGESDIQYATYFSVLNESDSAEWDSKDMVAALLSGSMGRMLEICEGDSGNQSDTSMIGICQDGCITTASFKSRRCGCSFCWGPECTECCDKSPPPAVGAPSVSMSNGSTKDVYLGGCPPYGISFSNALGEDVTGATTSDGAFVGTITVKPAGWNDEGGYQEDGNEESKYVTFEASNPICGNILYNVVDGCGSIAQGKVTCGCCEYDPIVHEPANVKCFEEIGIVQGSGTPVEHPLAAFCLCPISWSGPVSNVQQFADLFYSTAVFKAPGCGEHTVRATDSCGNVNEFTFVCSDICCPPEEPTEWDGEASADTIVRNGSANVYVKGTLVGLSGEFVWTVSGDGYTFSNGQTTLTGGAGQTVVAGPSSCGTADITVTDVCDEPVEGSLRNTDSGYWQSIYEDPCISPISGKCTYDYWHQIPISGTLEQGGYKIGVSIIHGGFGWQHSCDVLPPCTHEPCVGGNEDYCLGYGKDPLYYNVSWESPCCRYDLDASPDVYLSVGQNIFTALKWSCEE